ncbi:MAG: ABC transporter ATP-binding protein [Flavobacterium sp.]
METVTLIETKNLRFAYPQGNHFHFPDLKVKAANSFLISGPSGVGKTTLLHLLAGILQPTDGEIWINQTNVASLGGRKLDEFRGKNIGLVLQQNHFIQSLSVLDNVLMANWLATQQKNVQKAKELLEKLGIASQQNKATYQLSVGQQQRLSIARALINEPKLLLADEPTSSLDDHHAQSVIALLQELSVAYGASLVVVSHDQRLKEVIKDTVVLSNQISSNS